MKQLSVDWWIGLDHTYRTRNSDGSLVLWRPERTIWVNIWNDDPNASPRARLDHWIHDRSVEAHDLYDTEDHGLLRFGYLLEEPEETGGRMPGVYSYTVGRATTVQMACYFDLLEDLDWATALSRSLTNEPTEPGGTFVDTVGASGHFVMASENVLGASRAPVLRAFREPPANDQDSGWRFFFEHEFLFDPDQMALSTLSTLLTLDPTLRVIINQRPGSRWFRVSGDEADALDWRAEEGAGRDERFDGSSPWRAP